MPKLSLAKLELGVAAGRVFPVEPPPYLSSGAEGGKDHLCRLRRALSEGVAQASKGKFGVSQTT
jgi:hypothetical protein